MIPPDSAEPTAPPAVTEFAALSLSPAILQVVGELGYAHLTPVQARCIPLLLEGRDVVGRSRTGSGKTVAFAVPLLERLRLADRRLQALVLCPTRELCAQVAREIRKLGRHQPELRVLVLSGGQPLYPQTSALRKGVHVAVGTPGRVLDHLGRGNLDLEGVRFVVLDEADRMLEMGFQEDMERILGDIPPTRQTAFFSATFPRSIEVLSRTYQRDPVEVTIAEEERLDIRHRLYETEADDKERVLLALLHALRPSSAIVFCNLKVTVAALTQTLAQAGMSVTSLHGDLEQFERDRVMAGFRNLSTRILVATDVAARGIDIDDLEVVFNYDLPSQPEVYVHRVGRTARAGRSGLAVALATPREEGKVRRIEQFAQVTLERGDLAALAQVERAEPQEARMKTLRISGGRKDKLRPGDILGALTGEAGGLAATDVGRIEIHDHFAYVAVAAAVAEVALERLRAGTIKGRKFRVGVATMP